MGAAAIGGIALIASAIVAFGGLTFWYFAAPRKPVLDPVTLCPNTGAYGVNVVLVDTSDDLPSPAQRQVLGILDDQIMKLPEYYLLDIRVLDISAQRSRSLFSKCNPGDDTGLSEWTDNPRLARMRWIESFRQPAAEAVKNSLAVAKANSSPIMAAIQDIALQRFSSAAAQNIPKELTVISDMLEHTRDYSQYPAAGDLSYDRFKRSIAYRKLRTDLHNARTNIEYVSRAAVKIDDKRHMEFWGLWIQDNRGSIGLIRRLQGA